MKCRWMITVLFLLTVPITAFARGSRGYIRLTMTYEGQSIGGGTVTLYDVSNSPESLAPEEMVVYVKEMGIPGLEKKVNDSGSVMFDDLPAGRFLLVQQNGAPGYYPIKPFMIRLEQTAGGTAVNGIDASPKLEPEKKLPQTGQLVWPAWAFIGFGLVLIGIGLNNLKRE